MTTRKSVTLEVTEAQEQLLLRVLALNEELEHLADTAPDATVIESCELAVLSGGRDVQRLMLQDAVQRRIDVAEKKGRRSGSATAVGPKRTGDRPRAR